MKKNLLLVVIIFIGFAYSGYVSAGTTGKVTLKVIDEEDEFSFRFNNWFEFIYLGC